MSMRVLLLGRKPFDESEFRPSPNDLDVTVRTGTTIDDVGAAFDAGPVDAVIMGAGLALDIRLAIVRAVFEASTSTSVHTKERDSGQAGMLAFVRSVGANGRAEAPSA